MRKTTRVLIVGLFAFAIAMISAPVLGVEKIVAENLSFKLGPTDYKIKKLEAEGAALSAADIAKFFDAKEIVPAKERFARLNATRVVIPEIAGETAAAGAKQQFVYRDVVLENVVAGRIGAMRASSLEQTIDRSQGGRINAHYGPISAKNIDLTQIAHIYGDARADDKEPMKPVQDDVVIENASLAIPDAQFELRIARIIGKGIEARATDRPLSQRFDDIAAIAVAPTAEQSAALTTTALEAIEGFKIGFIEAQDIVASGAGAKPYTLKIARVTLAKVADSVIGEVSIDDVSYAGADLAKLNLRRAALRGLEFRPLFEGGERRFPRVAHVDLSALEADLPDPSVSDAAREKFRVATGFADLGAYRDGAPTSVSSRVDHWITDLSARGGAPADAQLIALGYKEVDLSWAFDGQWREKEQELFVREAMLSGRDMGRVEFSATLANVTPLLFSPSPILSRAAALSMLVKRVDATVVNMGLVDKTLDLEAKAKGVDPAKLRADYSASAAALITAYFDGSDKARLLADAVGKFVASSNQLHLKAQSAKGVGVIDAMTSKPGELLQGLEIEAKASP